MRLLITTFLARHKTTILVFFGVGIILLIAARQWASIEAAVSQLVVRSAALALLLLVFANVIAALLFALLASDKGTNFYTRLELSSVFLISQSAKYVPGKVWSILMQAAYLRGRFTAGTMVVANIEVALLVLGAVSMIGIGIAIWTDVAKPFGLLVAIAGILATVLMVRRGPLRQMTFRGFARFGGRAADSDARVRTTEATGGVGVPYLLLIGFAIFYVAGWLVFAGPALGIEIQIALKWVGLMSLSYALGVLSMFPAGIGVREASIYLLAAYSGVDPGQAASIAVLSRIMMLAIDACGILAGSAVLLAISNRQGEKQ
ncbi:MAG: flippase-like domain-containing protein [Rhodanobacteraceae bacterium]|nr:flippase-like domain-containing protein [Rhodanobacteraceae bacterium]